jgi:DNA-binding winged helix-turn-helix (wHTH) protein
VKSRFLGCVLDTDARSLARDATGVHLTPKAFDVLALLVAERPRAIPKAELLDRVWPDTFVTDASLARTIHEIRAAIGDGPEGSAIRTVHGHGYAFVAAVQEEPVAPNGAVNSQAQRPALAWLVSGPRSVPLIEGMHVAGRDPSAGIPVESTQTSWHHARFIVTADSVTIEDLDSKNGTRVNGIRLKTPARLCDGDEVMLGTVRFVCRIGERPVKTATAEP